MKRITTLFLLCLIAVVAWSGERIVIFDPTQDGDISTMPGTYIIEKDGVTMEISNGMVTGAHYRVYKNETITICAVEGEVIKIEFQCAGVGDAQYGPGCFVTNVGTYTYIDKIGNWEGRSRCVTFMAATNQVRITKVIVTISDGGLRAPVIKPASGSYYSPIEVSISCATPDATIHYTTDGSTPDEQSPVYAAPFVVDQDMTVNAVSILDGEMSQVVSADYVIRIPSTTGGCFEDLEPLAEGTVVRFKSPVYALAQHRNSLFVKDGCGGCALIWGGVGQTYTLGDVIPADFVVTKSFYSGEMELKEPANFQPASGNIPIEPEPITLDQVGHDLFAHYVVIEGVTFVEENGVYSAVDSLGNKVPLYFGTLDYHPSINLDDTYCVFGIIGSYGMENVIYEILPIKITPIHGEMLIGLGNYWKYIDPVNPPESITFNYDATVILQTGSYLYAKDASGYGLIYGQVGQTYKHGDVIPAGFSGKPTFYDGFPELMKPLSGFQPPKDHVVVIPEEVTIPQICPEYWAHYVIINGVIIDKERGVIRDQYGNELPIYIRSGLTFTYPDDLSQWTSVRGIVDYHNNQPQLLVWDIDEKDPAPVHCLQDTYNLENPNASFLIKLVVIYQNGANLYAQDLCGDYMLLYGNIGGPFVNGDTIEGVAHWGVYQSSKQLVPEGDWALVGHGLPVEPEDIGCTEEANQEMCHWYVRFDNVEIVTEDGNTYIEDECDRLLLFNKFKVEIPGPELPIAPPRNPYDLNNDGEVNIADLNCLIDSILSGKIDYDWTWTQQDDGEMRWNVSGFLSIFNNLLELYPIEITSAGATHIIGDLNFDGELNIADVNDLIDKIIAND